MILVALCSFILGGTVVFLYYAYFGKDKEIELKAPLVVYKPTPIHEQLFEKTKELYKANIKQSLDIIKTLIETTDYVKYQEVTDIARKFLEEWEGKI